MDLELRIVTRERAEKCDLKRLLRSGFVRLAAARNTGHQRKHGDDRNQPRCPLHPASLSEVTKRTPLRTLFCPLSVSPECGKPGFYARTSAIGRTLNEGMEPTLGVPRYGEGVTDPDKIASATSRMLSRRSIAACWRKRNASPSFIP